jgi:hypothetical protein
MLMSDQHINLGGAARSAAPPTGVVTIWICLLDSLLKCLRKTVAAEQVLGCSPNCFPYCLF